MTGPPAREFVDQAEHSVFTPVMCPILVEVAGPDVVTPHRPKPDAWAVVEPEPFDPLLIDHPARRA